MNRAAAVYSGGFSVSINPRLCHSEPVTDVTGVGIRNLLAGNLRKSAGIMRFGNGLPRQCVHWLAMTGFFDSLKPPLCIAAAFCLSGELPWADRVVRPYNAGHEPHKMGHRRRRPYGRFAASVRRTGFAHPAARKRKTRDGSLCGFHNN